MIMNDTVGEKIELGKKVQIEDKSDIEDTSKAIFDGSKPLYRIIRKKTNFGLSSQIVYIRINFDNEKKKDAYRKINRILGEG